MAAGLYSCAVAGGILLLILAPISGLSHVAGGPQAGLFLVLGGSLTFLLTGLRRLRTRGPAGPE